MLLTYLLTYFMQIIIIHFVVATDMANKEYINKTIHTAMNPVL